MNPSVIQACFKVKLPAADKLVLIRLAQEADENGGGIALRVQEVADDCGMSPRNVQYIVKKLRDAGILIVAGSDRGGRGRAAEHCIDLRRCRELAGGETTQTTQTTQEPLRGLDDENHANHASQIAGFSSPYMEELTSTEVKRSEEGARAISPGVEVIRAFDAERIAAYGEHQARAYPAGTDLVFADRWLASGADPDLCRAVFAGAMRRYASTGRKPPDTLSYFDRAVADAVATKNAPPTEGTAHVQAAKPAAPHRETASEATQRRRAGLAAAVDRRLGQP
ncbi:helix-turn-helix domain-containing protein [Azospirillum picis]|uniref:DNA-binding transcriptional ArsR family regulator n=1 Tax=Azospirillum picis TaxID=488438 RepID=A0ABU0MQB9_9PROT|nr:helix-turn-helix domain-containing protein [Azospirillum picis]MBP2301551.1 DNA-binding transcriptional ArsR family regulator [Azospirillum picis]MDQ0535383.1 DNA-binding transcriptional ArsR family regulator [Azospirillum picis]